MSTELLYELSGVGKEFMGPTEKLIILHKVDLALAEGDSVAVLGASGSGKTTLLHILGTLDTASQGDVKFRGRDMNEISDEERARIRNTEIGFVFQFHHLLPEFTTLENVAMQGIIGGMDKEQAFSLAAEALTLVEMQERKDHRVTTLSGGERQRAAIARAVLMKPKVILADEPTGNLDERTGDVVGSMLLRLNEELGTTLVVVTHNHELARSLNRRLELRAGELYVHEDRQA